MYRYYLQHPICYMFPHVWLDLLLNILEVVIVRYVELLGMQHVSEHPAVLQEHWVQVGLADVGHLWGEAGHRAAVPVVRGHGGVRAQHLLAK